MQRGSDSLGGLGPQLVGERIHVNRRVTSVIRQLGEGTILTLIHVLNFLVLNFDTDDLNFSF
jgi:hypothetical protein